MQPQQCPANSVTDPNAGTYSENYGHYSTPFVLRLLLVSKEMKRCQYLISLMEQKESTAEKKEQQSKKSKKSKKSTAEKEEEDEKKKVEEVFDIPEGSLSLSLDELRNSYDHLQCLFLILYITLCHSDNIIDTDPFILQHPRPTISEL
jgi:ATPase subunit of ABC transporter with duplicated ATPase domains